LIHAVVSNLIFSPSLVVYARKLLETWNGGMGSEEYTYSFRLCTAVSLSKPNLRIIFYFLSLEFCLVYRAGGRNVNFLQLLLHLCFDTDRERDWTRTRR